MLYILYLFVGDELYVDQRRAGSSAAASSTTVASFEIDSPGEVFAYGRFDCGSGTGYASVIAFGRSRINEDIRNEAALV